jgi:rod shape-determining protein MreD
MTEYVKYAAVLLVLAVVQKTLIWVLAVTSYEITPDILLIGLVYVSIRKGKIAGSLGGFLFGLLLDFFSFSFLGLMALAKASAGFTAGFFNNENKVEKNTQSYIFIIIIFISSLINNVIYFMLYFQGTILSFKDILLRYVIPTAIYTAVIGILPLIIIKRRAAKRY